MSDNLSDNLFADINAAQQGYEPPQAEPRRSRVGCWLIGLVVAGLLCLLVCCGGGVALLSFTGQVISTEIEDQLADNPRLREHLGDIESFEMDWARSISHDDDEAFIYEVQGTKGKGRVTVKQITNDEGDEEILSAELRLPDGTTIDLAP